MSRRLGRKKVIRKRAPLVATDTHDQVPDWDTPALATIAGCSVQPGTGSTYQTEREAATVLFTVFAPPRADVVHTDRIEYRGKDYDIDSIEDWRVGSRRDHLVIRLKKVNG